MAFGLFGCRIAKEEEIRMATARLRVFPRPDEETQAVPHDPAIPIRLADLYPLPQAYFT